MLKRIQNIYDKIDQIFLNKYFDCVFPKDKYDIKLITEGPPIIHIKNKDESMGWMMYSNFYYLQYYNNLKAKVFRKHLAAFKIQRWWIKKYYDPKLKVIHRVMNRKFDEYVYEILVNNYNVNFNLEFKK